MDAQGSTDVPAAAEVALADGMATAADTGWLVPDGLPPICLTMTARSEWAWADLMAVIDRSSSMGLSLAADVACAPGATDCTTRRDAVQSTLVRVGFPQPHFRWGAVMFPSVDGESCAVAPVPEVPLSENPAEAMAGAMSTLARDDRAPTGAAIRSAVTYLDSRVDRDFKGILLFTDGEPSCPAIDGGSSWNDALDAAGAASAHGYPFIVFGLGPNPGDLDGLAAAGGTTHFYHATSQAQLDDMLDSLFWHGDSWPCVFSLGQPPPDPSLVYVFINGEPIPQDETDGWSLGGTAVIILNGRACELTLALNPVEVSVLVGCGDAGSP